VIVLIAPPLPAAALEDDRHPQALVADPFLELHELDLERGELAQVRLVRDRPNRRADLLHWRIRPDVGELDALLRLFLLGLRHDPLRQRQN
jgi:hypothetical protein